VAAARCGGTGAARLASSMILVTGTMRSGTSMWMQILVAAGLPHIGDAFPAPWAEGLRSANPRGFYESQLVAGVYYATNPHPETGAYLFPEQTREHVAKVFIPGLVRTDLAFIDRVVATVRGWRQYCASLAGMRSLAGEDREELLFDVPVSPPLRWWMENFSLVRDVATRRYAAHVVTYDRLLSDPEQQIDTVLRWIGRGDRAAALSAVDRQLRNFDQDTPAPEGLEPRHAAVFDELYDHLHHGRDLAPSFVDLLNRTDEELRPQLLVAREQARDALIQHLAANPEG
jgi:hypothetical protein